MLALGENISIRAGEIPVYGRKQKWTHVQLCVDLKLQIPVTLLSERPSSMIKKGVHSSDTGTVIRSL